MQASLELFLPLRGAGRRPRARREESIVVRQCLTWLRTHGFVAWRQNQGAMRVEDPNTGDVRFVRFAHVKGIADIIGLMPDGRFLAVECKDVGGESTPEQIAFRQMIIHSGGVAGAVFNTRELAALIQTAQGNRTNADQGSNALPV